ncbi:hypothetical protein ACPOL_5534 [Acidisarcina polymorpha]|uniref:Uncharacterized protein n=1 Tax=Acidisarcina polymorpha TaxID=2211140 RepID=A0A2Z5G6B8_9BACT|nr:hypothetical protein ACPOL_5534 [Acidisarcina polymorpha]
MHRAEFYESFWRNALTAIMVVLLCYRNRSDSSNAKVHHKSF